MKLVASDLDGTIIRFDAGISTRTIEAFLDAHKKGARVLFATGRPPRWLGDVVDAFGTKIFPWVICCNGALLFDLHEGKVLKEWEISIADAFEIVSRLRKNLPGVTFAMERNDHYVRERRYIPRWDVGMDIIGTETIEEQIDRPFLKLIARCTESDLDSDEMLAIATPLLAGLATVTHSNPEDSLLEISAHGVHKGSALAYVAEQWGIDREEILVFGDNPNDIPMLEWATHSYAVASGHRGAHSAAKNIAPACNEDGVAQIIEKVFAK